MSESENNTLSSEFTGPGSAYMVLEQYKNGEYNACGQKPVFIKPDEPEKKNINRLN